MTLRALHITMGSVGLLAGAFSMTLRKGSRAHARAGLAFTASMALMAVSGVLLATVIKPNRGNAIGGLFTLYLLLTAWVTVWRKPGTIGLLEKIGCCVGLLVSVAGVTWGRMAQAQPSHRLDGYPPTLFFAFSLITALAAISDLRLLYNGGIRGPARTTRHLWRMCVAMLVATSSFFLGMASKRFPAFVLQQRLNMIPVVLVMLALGWFLVRTRVVPAWRTRRRALLLPGSA